MNPGNITLRYSNGSSCDPMDNSFAAQVTRFTLLSTILVISLVGNVLIIVIVYKRKELRKTTNYFIVNMAVSDFVFPLQAIPLRLFQIALGSSNWPFTGTTGSISCKVGSYLRRVSATVSMASLLWIALDRCMAVVWPMKANFITPRKRAIAIASTWAVALMLNSIDLYAYDLVKQEQNLRCDSLPETLSILRNIGHVRKVFSFGLLIPISILYSLTMLTLRRKEKALRDSEGHKPVKNKQRAIKMSFLVVITMNVYFLPILVFVPLLDGLSCPSLKELGFFAYVMLYLSSTVNPIICMVCVRNYRRGLAHIFKSFRPKRAYRYNISGGHHA
ncbi:neuropeptide FF receptor 1-like [Montipora foliosa]|uniref:neuropeptide FF receptor 1-like n=1 Tax=Montipora foliosa TaxID=591990 RepID=UPI0035F15A8B